jgi:hypothetical protein
VCAREVDAQLWMGCADFVGIWGSAQCMSRPGDQCRGVRKGGTAILNGQRRGSKSNLKAWGENGSDRKENQLPISAVGSLVARDSSRRTREKPHKCRSWGYNEFCCFVLRYYAREMVGAIHPSV